MAPLDYDLTACPVGNVPIVRVEFGSPEHEEMMRLVDQASDQSAGRAAEEAAQLAAFRATAHAEPWKPTRPGHHESVEDLIGDLRQKLNDAARSKEDVLDYEP